MQTESRYFLIGCLRFILGLNAKGGIFIASPSNFIDLIGQKFNRLTVIKRVENSKDDRACWLCKCDCGNEIIVKGKDLRNGHTKSCGCLKQETSAKIC